MTETLAHGTHLTVLSESSPMNTNMTGLRWFSKKVCPCDLEENSLSIERVNRNKLERPTVFVTTTLLSSPSYSWVTFFTTRLDGSNRFFDLSKKISIYFPVCQVSLAYITLPFVQLNLAVQVICFFIKLSSICSVCCV